MRFQGENRNAQKKRAWIWKALDRVVVSATMHYKIETTCSVRALTFHPTPDAKSPRPTGFRQRAGCPAGVHDLPSSRRVALVGVRLPPVHSILGDSLFGADTQADAPCSGQELCEPTRNSTFDG